MSPEQPEKLSTETDKGNGPKPPVRTAIGSGGPGDDWDGLIGDLRCYDLDDVLDREEAEFWPLRQLSSVRVLSNRRSANDAQAMRESLARLYRLKSNVALFVSRHDGSVQAYVGVFPPTIGDHAVQRADQDPMPAELPAILQSAYPSIEVGAECVPMSQLTSQIAPLAGMVGCVTGMPRKGLSDLGGCSNRILDVVDQGTFGFLVAAAPIPVRMIAAELSLVVDQVHKLGAVNDPSRKRRNKYCLELLQAYESQLQESSQSLGGWQTVVYYFSPDEGTFERLRGELQSCLSKHKDEGRPSPIKVTYNEGLKQSLLECGLPSNRRLVSTVHALRKYKFMTPLSSAQLAAYFHVPWFDR